MDQFRSSRNVSFTLSTSQFEDFLALHPHQATGFRSNGLFQTIQYRDTAKYWGTVRVANGQIQRHGFGRYQYANGALYDGQWKQDLMTSYGQLYYPDGNMAYEGGWLDGKFDGLGVQYNNTPEVAKVNYKRLHDLGDAWVKYEGYHKEDLRQGFGKLVLLGGAYYQGQFVDDVPSGEGFFHSTEGSVSAQWSQGKLY